MKNLYLESHMFITAGACNFNRDELGIPKTITMGDALRGRFSSQSQNSAVRSIHAARDSKAASTTRTRDLAAKTAENVAERLNGVPEDRLLRAAGNMVALVTRAPMDSGMKLKALSTFEKAEREAMENILVDHFAFFEQADVFTEADARAVLAASEEADEETVDGIEPADVDAGKPETGGEDRYQKRAKGVLSALKKSDKALHGKITTIMGGSPISTDLAMNGRLLAHEPKLCVESSRMVAHAFTTNEVRIENDFFTARDELSKNRGAGMMGSKAMISEGLFSFYFNYELLSLKNRIKDGPLFRQALRDELLARACIFGRGNQSNMASLTAPCMIMLNVSACPGQLNQRAFQLCVRPDPTEEKSLEKLSIDRLDFETWAFDHNYASEYGVENRVCLITPFKDGYLPKNMGRVEPDLKSLLDNFMDFLETKGVFA
jgi:CRISPR system Cascade subunit CasC